MQRSAFHAVLAGAAASLVTGDDVLAHGVAGNRFFPATLALEDPFVADELALPTISTLEESANEEELRTRETEYSAEWAKRITPRFSLSVEEALVHRNPRGEKSETGFGNVEVGGKYQFFESDLYEAVASLQLSAKIGGTGARRVEAERFTTVTPTLLFGKGFGDLPDSFGYLRPIALTGAVGVAIPTSRRTTTTSVDPDTGDVDTETERHPHVLEWGFALEYSLPYLQSQVRNVGLGAPFDRLIPLVEFVFDTPLNRGEGGRTEGTVNPGVIWAGQHIQLGIEAQIPVNERSGRGVGVLGQLHFYLDDLFPNSLGRPLFR